MNIEKRIRKEQISFIITFVVGGILSCFNFLNVGILFLTYSILSYIDLKYYKKIKFESSQDSKN